MPNFKDSGSTKVRDILFDEENIVDSTVVTTVAADSEMIIIPCIVGATHLVRVVD